MKLKIAAFALALSLPAGLLHAACTNPAGSAGDQVYDTNSNNMVFCNGTSWVSMAGGGTATSSGGATAAGGTNDVQYNSGGAMAADTGVFTYSGGVLKATTISTTNAYANTANFTLLYVGGVQVTGGGGGTPAGSTTQIQYNNAGAFGASSNLVYASSTNFLGVGIASPPYASTSLAVNGMIFSSSTVAGFFAFDRTVGTGLSGLYRTGNQTNLYDSTAGSVITYNNSGLVGIGQAPGSYKLTVNGDILANGWLRSSGSTGWYSETYGGGWYMADTTWVRSYSNKPIYTGGVIRADSGFNVGGTAGTGTTYIGYCNGTISFTGGIAYSTGAWACDGDIAEHYGTEETVLRGDIVMVGTTTTSRDFKVLIPSPGETSKTTYTITTANVRKATYGQRERILGAVPTAPMTIGGDKIDPKDNPQQVALVGHVPVHMTLEGGPVAIGDPITVAENTPGAGMKATTSGRILGYALEPYTKKGDSKDDMIEVFIHLEDWEAPHDKPVTMREVKALRAEFEAYKKANP